MRGSELSGGYFHECRNQQTEKCVPEMGYLGILWGSEEPLENLMRASGTRSYFGQTLLVKKMIFQLFSSA